MSHPREVGPKVLVVFAKWPAPGQVKTRMSPAIDPETAAAFYREMLLDVLDESARACEALGLEGFVTVAPASSAEAFASLVPSRFTIVAQCGGDLGSRMAFEVERALARGATRVVLRGSDNPALGADELARMFERLEQVDLVASPDRDGGYGAIGLRTSPGPTFEHEMSHAEVLPATLERARSAGLSVATTGGSFDLDTPGDLVQLREARDALGDRCARTFAFADAHDLWSRA